MNTLCEVIQSTLSHTVVPDKLTVIGRSDLRPLRRGLARATDTGYSNEYMCVRAACPSGRARCGSGADRLAMKHQSLRRGLAHPR